MKARLRKEKNGAFTWSVSARIWRWNTKEIYFLTDGRLLYAQNMSNLLLQNGYVLVMACGMLLCILTGGNIDLSVGSVICMVGGVAAVMITNHGFNI